MRYSFNTAAAFLSAITLASAQTFTDCNPTEKTCPADPALSTTQTTDFTKVTGTKAPAGWVYADGTTLSYDSENGAKFEITSKTGAPTMSLTKFIMFGRVTARIRASPGTGIVSSFILESSDLDEIDWEWLGSTDSSVESNFFGKGNTTTYNRALYHDVSTPIETYHTYVIDWTKDRVNWYIDDLNTPVRTLTYADPVALGGKNYPQTPMLVKMGSWVGCPDDKDPAIKGTCEWAGGLARFPASYSMYVQSVTVEDYGCGTEYVYGDQSGSYQSIVSKGDCDGNTLIESSSSAESKPTSTKTSSKAASSTASSTAKSSAGGVFADVSSSSSASSATGTSSASSGSKSTTDSAAQTTLSTGTAVAATSGTQTGTGTSSTSTPSTAASAASKKFGTLDYSVMVLGLGLGYLVM